MRAPSYSHGTEAAEKGYTSVALLWFFLQRCYWKFLLARDALTLTSSAKTLSKVGDSYHAEKLLEILTMNAMGAVEAEACDLASIVYNVERTR